MEPTTSMTQTKTMLRNIHALDVSRDYQRLFQNNAIQNALSRKVISSTPISKKKWIKLTADTSIGSISRMIKLDRLTYTYHTFGVSVVVAVAAVVRLFL